MSVPILALGGNTKIKAGTKTTGSETQVYIELFSMNKSSLIAVTESGSDNYIVGLVFNKQETAYGQYKIISSKTLTFSGSSGQNIGIYNVTSGATVRYLVIEF